MESSPSSQNLSSSSAASSASASTSTNPADRNAAGSGAARGSETAGVEQISGLNAQESPEQAIGKIKQLGELNSQTGAAGRAKAELAAADAAGASSEQPEWQTAIQATLQQGWKAVANRVKSASPTELALGAAAVGAAVWLGTRKRSSSAAAKQQSSADRWNAYPTADAQNNPAGGRYTGSAGARSQYDGASTPGGAETWQRPTSDRWDPMTTE